MSEISNQIDYKQNKEKILKLRMVNENFENFSVKDLKEWIAKLSGKPN